MLQQTTLPAVLGRYERFLARFPTLTALARASEEQVLAAWSGLGYYGRARNLLRAARRIREDHGGRLPRDPDALRRLPGFGPYTAAAVASIAYGVPVPAADANVTRVVSRLFALPGAAGSRRNRDAVLRHAARLLPRDRPGDFTAGLMDLGQLLCTPRRPACPRCPLAPDCAARKTGRPERFPRTRPKPRAERVAVAAADVRSAGRTLLLRREGTLLSGLWVHPFSEGRTAAQARRSLAAALPPLGCRLSGSAPSGEAAHAIVNRRFAIKIYPAVRDPGAGIRNPGPAGRWFRPEDLARAALPALTRKIARAAGFLRR